MIRDKIALYAVVFCMWWIVGMLAYGFGLWVALKGLIAPTGLLCGLLVVGAFSK